MPLTMGADTSILPSVTTLVIIGLGVVRAAPFMQYEPLQEWSKESFGARVGNHQDILGSILKKNLLDTHPIRTLGSIHKRSILDTHPIHTLLCMKRKCTVHNDDGDIVGVKDCTWQMCRSLLTKSAASSNQMTSYPVSPPSRSAVSHTTSPPAHVDVNIIEEEEELRTDKHLLVRRKRWQYADALQVCIAQKCQGLKEVRFYQCVYKKCIGHQ